MFYLYSISIILTQVVPIFGQASEILFSRPAYTVLLYSAVLQKLQIRDVYQIFKSFSKIYRFFMSYSMQVDTDPLPFSVTAAGAVLLVELAAVNLHIVFLLVALARSPEPAEGWYAPVRPPMYR
jgi:hypothetical protein